MSTKGKKYFVNKSSQLLHSYYAVNSVDSENDNISSDPGRFFKDKFDPKSRFVISIISFFTHSIHRLREFLAPKLIRSFDTVPVLIKNKKN